MSPYYNQSGVTLYNGDALACSTGAASGQRGLLRDESALWETVPTADAGRNGKRDPKGGMCTNWLYLYDG